MVVNNRSTDAMVAMHRWSLEEDLRFQEEIRFHKENPNTCEFCRKKCDGNIDMMEQCVVTRGRHSIPIY